MKFAKVLEPYGLYFLEEPCWPESVEGLAAINEAVATPIVAGSSPDYVLETKLVEKFLSASPEQSRGSHCCFCASVPQRSIEPATSEV